MASRYHGAVVDVTGTEVRLFDTDCSAEMAGWLTAQGATIRGAITACAWDMEADGVPVDVDMLRERALAERDALAAQVAVLADLLDRWKLGAYASLTEDATDRALADIPAAGRAFLPERDELRARLAKAEAENDGEDEARPLVYEDVGPTCPFGHPWNAIDQIKTLTERAERAETVLRETLDDVEATAAEFYHGGEPELRSQIAAVVAERRAYFAAAAPEEEKR